ncbi:hypothetical protein KFK09_011630 [Dendrobium nobile]|uniref:Reverse transcriptase domain-containing protein n=1 Tax=Dendrobium nobile TaxID=94219 RepID=A0A8T3BD68_DENNO|nr:hypothetical protein KFK09_011630 [Dendrobium nobile]
MPFGLKNAPSEFQKIMNEIFNSYNKYIIVYIDDVLIFSKSIDEHFKHLKTFIWLAKSNGLVISEPKIKLFQTTIRFLGHTITNDTIVPIQRSIEFADKFPDKILDKKQLQRFLGALNYVSDFYQNLAKDAAPLFKRLRKNSPPWDDTCTKVVQIIKHHVKNLPCINLANPNYFKIVETDASDLGYGGILKQKNH